VDHPFSLHCFSLPTIFSGFACSFELIIDSDVFDEVQEVMTYLRHPRTQLILHPLVSRLIFQWPVRGTFQSIWSLALIVFRGDTPKLAPSRRKLPKRKSSLFRYFPLSKLSNITLLLFDQPYPPGFME